MLTREQRKEVERLMRAWVEAEAALNLAVTERAAHDAAHDWQAAEREAIAYLDSITERAHERKD